jgi:two-component system, LytTR family, response regulator LytT
MPINCIIIEDELPNAERLALLLQRQNKDIVITATLQTIMEAISWFTTNPMPDLIFSDIRLTDGLSFDLFKQVKITAPVIFTTAYDEYAIQAFTVNSIDYLLKPIDAEELDRALSRYADRRQPITGYDSLLPLLEKMQAQEPVYRQRFLVSYRDQLIPVLVKEIAYFHSAFKQTWMVTHSGQKYTLPQTMEELDLELNPHAFFRITRQYIASSAAIKSIYTHFNGRLKLELLPPVAEEILVSRDRSQALRDWFDR